LLPDPEVDPSRPFGKCQPTEASGEDVGTLGGRLPTFWLACPGVRPGSAAVKIDREGWGMAGEGSAALGAPELAGAMVNPRGFGKKASVGAIGGAVGAVAATAVASRSKASDVPARPGCLYRGE
jgi:hypothetical protein